MYIVWNAIKNLARNKGRNILMAVIVFAVIVATVVSIIINSTTASIIKDYKGRFGSEISIEVKRDGDATVQYSDNTSPGADAAIPKTPTSGQVLEFGKSDYLKTAEYTTYRNGVIVDKTAAPSKPSTDRKDPSEEKRTFITGSSRDYINQDFKKGTKKIVDGKKYENPGECLIPEEYAKKHKLSIGDTITVDLDIYDSDINVSGFERYTFKITGTYANYSIKDRPMSDQMCEMLVDLDTLTNLDSFEIDGEMQVFGTFFLKDPNMLKDFTSELQKKGLSDDMQVLTDEAGYKQVVGPVEGLAKISTTFMVAVLILGCAILLVLSILTIRERKYEIGVLRAMGMKKTKVAVGLLTESIIITAMCLVLGLGVGMAVSQPVADSLLSDQVKIAEESQQNSMGMMQMGQNPDKENLSTLSEIDVQLNTQAITQIILIALLIAGISSVVGIFYITRYEPMQILSERN